jgi:hypothetical protein
MVTLFHFASPVNVENFGIGIFAAPAPAMPRGFVAIGGAYIPSDAESVWATLDAEQQEHERQEARWEALADEAFDLDVMEDEMRVIGAVG